MSSLLLLCSRRRLRRRLGYCVDLDIEVVNVLQALKRKKDIAVWLCFANLKVCLSRCGTVSQTTNTMARGVFSQQNMKSSFWYVHMSSSHLELESQRVAKSYWEEDTAETSRSHILGLEARCGPFGIRVDKSQCFYFTHHFNLI